LLIVILKRFFALNYKLCCIHSEMYIGMLLYFIWLEINKKSIMLEWLTDISFIKIYDVNFSCILYAPWMTVWCTGREYKLSFLYGGGRVRDARPQEGGGRWKRPVYSHVWVGWQTFTGPHVYTKSSNIRPIDNPIYHSITLDSK
jgi:hypothetical protein